VLASVIWFHTCGGRQFVFGRCLPFVLCRLFCLVGLVSSPPFSVAVPWAYRTLSYGGWIRNLVAKSFIHCKPLGSIGTVGQTTYKHDPGSGRPSPVGTEELLRVVSRQWSRQSALAPFPLNPRGWAPRGVEHTPPPPIPIQKAFAGHPTFPLRS